VWLDRRHALVLPHVEGEVARDRAVVGERVATRRLLPRHDEGHTAQRELLGGGEEAHVVGILRDRADDGASIEHAGGESGALRGDRRRQPARPRADDQQVYHGVIPQERSEPAVVLGAAKDLLFAG
jgi:hypothetical protein